MYEYGQYLQEKDITSIPVSTASDPSQYGYAMVPGKIYALTFSMGVFTGEQDAVNQAAQSVNERGAIVQYASVVNGQVYLQCYAPEEDFPGQGATVAPIVIILGIIVIGILAVLVAYFIGVALQKVVEFSRENKGTTDLIAIAITIGAASVLVIAVALAYRAVKGDKSFRDTIGYGGPYPQIPQQPAPVQYQPYPYWAPVW